MRHPQVDVVQSDARGLADLGCLPDEDVDGKLENVRADHVDEGLCVLGGVSPLLDVPAGHLSVSAAVRTKAPAEETGALGRGSHDRRAGSVSEDHSRAAVGVIEHAR